MIESIVPGGFKDNVGWAVSGAPKLEFGEVYFFFADRDPRGRWQPRLMADSVLRQTSEFAEIRYRYAQSHLFEGQQALRRGDPNEALAEAKLVLGVPGITGKQRRDAQRLMGRATAALRESEHDSAAEAQDR